MKSADTVFKAIAHPARREILALLSRKARSVRELTLEFAMSQPAISQHLKELREAELVSSERGGLEHRYRLTAGPLRTVFEWSAQYRVFFDPAEHSLAFVAQKAPRAGTGFKEDREDGS